MRVQEAWATRDGLFDTLLDAYKGAMGKIKSSKRVPMKKWAIPKKVRRQWTPEEFARVQKMQRMSTKCRVLLCYIYIPILLL